jgi:hypothetical protein
MVKPSPISGAAYSSGESMLYTVANMSWTPGDSLTPSMARCGLSRWRPKTEDIAAGCPTLAVALRYDETRGQVVAEGVTARGRSGPWSAPAIVDSAGGVMVLAPIPAALVRVVGTAELRVHPGTRPAGARSHVPAGQPASSFGRVRTVDGRPLSQTRARTTSTGKATSRPGPVRLAGKSHRPAEMARLEVQAPVPGRAGTTSASRGEAEVGVGVRRGPRPPPMCARGGLFSMAVPSVLEWNEDQ